MVWVPAYGTGVIGRFDPETEEWKIYPMPDAENRVPYALNIDPRNGDIWVCGTGSDALLHLNPKTGKFTEYLLPTMVTYTREIEIGEDGSIWTTNSNAPMRHIERGMTSFIKLEPGM
jgi:streptogramin lyase